MSMYSDRFIDIDFDSNPIEELLSGVHRGETLSATVLLTMLDGENEEVLQEAFDYLADLDVTLDISTLPKAAASGEAAVRLHREAQLVRTGKLLDNLEETDPLRLYLEEIAGIPVCGDLAMLAEDLAKANREERLDEGLWTRVLNLSLSRVVETAMAHTGYGVLLLDLIQEGSMGLWQRLECYVQGDLEQFVDREIRQAMARAVILQSHVSGVGSHMRQALEDYRSVDEKLLMELGRNPTLEEIADELHMTVAQTSQVADMVNNARLMNRAKAEQTPEEETEDDTRHVEDTAYFQMRQRIEELLSVLSEQEVKVLSLRFGLEGGLPLDATQTGRKLGLTAEEIVKIEAAALGRLRNE